MGLGSIVVLDWDFDFRTLKRVFGVYSINGISKPRFRVD